jgi:dUTP pyrophosphatase
MEKQELKMSEYGILNLPLADRVLVKKLRPDAVLPSYKKSGDAGFDLHAVEETVIHSGMVAIIPTGLAFAIPKGLEMQVRMRSGAALKTPLIVANAPGTIDSGYRGEVGIIVRNLGQNPFTVAKGERIAQGVIAPVVKALFIETDSLPDSERGADGYGSTGSN